MNTPIPPPETFTATPARAGCTTCPHAKPLAFAVYCKADADLRDLPLSIGHIVGTPLVQATAPVWCPLLTLPE